MKAHMHRIKKLLNNKFFRSIATLMSGSIFAQIISFCISPLMTRLYTEEQIGEYTLLLTVVTMFGTVICGRYDMVIVGEKEDKNMYALIKLSFVLTVILSVLVGIGYTVYTHVTESTTMSFIALFFWNLAFLLCAGILNILHSYNNRYREYKKMATASVTKELGKGVALVGLGLLKFGIFGLLISYLLSRVLELWQQMKRLRNNFRSLLSVTWEEMRQVAKKYAEQPLFSVPASFANSFSYSVINLFVNALFGTVTLAYYSMSYRMLGMPLSLISGSTSKAYYEKAAREYDASGKFNRTFMQTSLLLLVCAIPMTIGLMLLAPWAFELFFGDGWGISGVYVRYLAPMFAFRLIISPLTPTMIIVHKQKVELLFQTSFIVASVTAYIIGRVIGSIEIFLLSITVLFAVVYILYYLYMLRLSFKKGENK